jgi:hypothetical protein
VNINIEWKDRTKAILTIDGKSIVIDPSTSTLPEVQGDYDLTFGGILARELRSVVVTMIEAEAAARNVGLTHTWDRLPDPAIDAIEGFI